MVWPRKNTDIEIAFHLARVKNGLKEYTYKNSFFKQGDPNSGPYHYVTRVHPVEYRGYLIFHRVNHVEYGADVFDIVKYGVCIGQYAGPNGAKRTIDIILSRAASKHE